MTDKDPKDMTVSELLRLAAGEGEQGGWTGTVCKLAYLVGISDLRICELNNCDLLDESYKVIADKIDAELAEARDLSLLAGAELWAKANGWPDFRAGEDFGQWLDRCTYKKPVDDCNEPVQFGDEIELHYLIGGADKGRFQEVTVNRGPVWMLSFTGVDHERLYRYDSECDILKRPAPEVLLGDGKPVSKGETVYVIESGIERTVKDFGTKLCEGMDGWDGSPWVMFDNGSWMHARELTHTPPDTQESVDRDARKGYMTYWECVECSCERCPARIDGDKPWRWYHADSCEGAMVLDLLRRQRELDKRKGGE